MVIHLAVQALSSASLKANVWCKNFFYVHTVYVVLFCTKSLQINQFYGIRIRSSTDRGLRRRKMSVLFVGKIVHTARKHCKFLTVFGVKVFTLDLRFKISEETARRELFFKGKKKHYQSITSPWKKIFESKGSLSAVLSTTRTEGNIVRRVLSTFFSI